MEIRNFQFYYFLYASENVHLAGIMLDAPTIGIMPQIMPTKCI